MSDLRERIVPPILCGVDGEPPTYVSTRVADTAEAAVAYAVESGEVVLPPEGASPYPVRRVLMRELDEIACKIAGHELGWWVECTTRAKAPEGFWRIDDE